MSPCFKWLIFMEKDSLLLSVTWQKNKLPPLEKLKASKSQKGCLRRLRPCTEAASSEKVVSLETKPVGARTHLKMYFPDLLPTLRLKEVLHILMISGDVVQPSV